MEVITNSNEEKSYGISGYRPLMRNNFILMALSGLLIVVGFILMAGGSSETTQYNPEIFSTRRIVVGPMLSFIGYVLMAISIILKPKQK